MKLVSKLGEWEGEFNLDPNTPIDIAEKMCLQFLYHCAKVREAALNVSLIQEENKIEEFKQEEPNEEECLTREK